MEIFDGMDFTPETDRQVLSKVIEKVEEFCIGETNETYERFIFNRRGQEENESIDQYVTVLRKLAQTYNFCNCLHDSLIRDRLVLGIRDESIRKKLLQEKKLSLSRAVDIGRSGETTTMRLKELKNKAATAGTDEEINVLKTKRTNNEKSRRERATILTDEEIAQSMDRHARNVAAGMISPKPFYKEIPAKDTRQRTS